MAIEIGNFDPDPAKASIDATSLPQHENSLTSPRLDNIDMSQAIINPDAISRSAIVIDSRPVWQRENAQLFSSHPQQDRYVIWKYDPSEEGVSRYPRFGKEDILPYHYFRSYDEYQAAYNRFRSGGYTEKVIDVFKF